MKTYSISYHGDFDGVNSAALVLDYLVNKREVNLEDVILIPVDYNVLDIWKEKPLPGDEKWVVDFEPHYDANYWIDHHHTRSKYHRAKDNWFYGNYKSCAGLIYQKLLELFGYRNPFFQACMLWTDVIDSASFNRPEEAFLDTNPAVRLSLALISPTTDDSFRNHLVKTLCKEMQYDSVEGSSPEVKLRVLRSIGERDNGMYFVKENSFSIYKHPLHFTRLTQDNSGDKIITSFMVYYYFPSTDFSLIIKPNKVGYSTISIGSNPFKSKIFPLNIGNFLKNRFEGGGGHLDAGGARLSKNTQPSEAFKEVEDGILKDLHKYEHFLSKQ